MHEPGAILNCRRLYAEIPKYREVVNDYLDAGKPRGLQFPSNHFILEALLRAFKVTGYRARE